MEGQAEEEPVRPVTGDRALLLPPQVLQGWQGRSHLPLSPAHPCPSASSFPEHPIAQLLRKLQCAVYTRLYPAVSQSNPEATPAASTGLAFLSLDAGGLLPAEPGGRRLRASRSLHCMFSVPEHGPATLRHSISGATLADGSPDASRAEGDPRSPRESSFEDLERFLASPEDWPPAEPMAKPRPAASLQEQLKGIVRDIHNAIGEGRPWLWEGGGVMWQARVSLCPAR